MRTAAACTRYEDPGPWAPAASRGDGIGIRQHVSRTPRPVQELQHELMTTYVCVRRALPHRLDLFCPHILDNRAVMPEPDHAVALVLCQRMPMPLASVLLGLPCGVVERELGWWLGIEGEEAGTAHESKRSDIPRAV